MININYFKKAVTSAMRKNARWSGMGVSGLRMGGLGNSMGLRSAQMNSKDSQKKEVNHTVYVYKSPSNLICINKLYRRIL